MAESIFSHTNKVKECSVPMSLPSSGISNLENFTILIEGKNYISLMFEFAFSLLLRRVGSCLCFNLPFVFCVRVNCLWMSFLLVSRHRPSLRYPCVGVLWVAILRTLPFSLWLVF